MVDFDNCGTKICNWSAHFAIGVGTGGGGGGHNIYTVQLRSGSRIQMLELSKVF